MLLLQHLLRETGVYGQKVCKIKLERNLRILLNRQLAGTSVGRPFFLS